MFEGVAEILCKTGTVGVIPTDTLYGLVARAADPEAVERLYSVKNREGKPGTLIACDLSQLEELGIKRRYVKAVEQYWPGSISVVVPCSDPKLNYLHQGKMSLAVRIPDHSELLELLAETGPLITTSANLPGEDPAKTIDDAKATFGNQIDLYVDGGDYVGHEPSTIIRIVDDAIEIIREGAVKLDESGRQL